jgi:hypothetical protein
VPAFPCDCPPNTRIRLSAPSNAGSVDLTLLTPGEARDLAARLIEASDTVLLPHPDWCREGHLGEHWGPFTRIGDQCRDEDRVDTYAVAYADKAEARGYGPGQLKIDLDPVPEHQNQAVLNVDQLVELREALSSIAGAIAADDAAHPLDPVTEP